MTATPQLPLDVAATFAGKRILFTGATGFLGQVALSLLLHRYGDALDCVWVLVRRGSAVSAERRFFDKVVPNEPFRPLREKYGDGVTEFFARKCRVLDGDITDPGFGLSAEQLAALDGQVDVVINSAGLVSFNPSLELALDVNTLGVRHGVELCQRWKVPLSHVSTAFVVGNRSGLVFEDDAIEGYFPKKGELDGRDFSLDQELADCRRTVERLRERAEDRTLTSSFRERALSRLAQEGRDARDEKTLRLAVGRERKLWLSGELTRVGMERAAHWGWPNTYTYSKSLGEQVLAGTPGLSYAILRPSIVESALRYPFPGWNEGFTTSAPLSFACIKGRARVPAGTQTILDIVPVDLVASALLAATARVMASGGRRVYHLASGDVNPFYAARSVELVGLYRRRYYREKKTGSRAWNHFLSRLEPQAVSLLEYKASSAPAWIQGAKLLKGVIQEVKPSWG
ncbi:MAG TPA: SDR family oxidoreductase, partial [Myxococcaceae bacterium]|nr:SDR family oxidoreductase [Myxococcaceae bacterium]